MSNLLNGVVGLVIGLVWGSVFASDLFFGPAVQLSAGTGISVGMCSAAQTAVAEGYLTTEEANRVIDSTAQQAEQLLPSLPRNELISNHVECDVALVRLRNVQR